MTIRVIFHRLTLYTVAAMLSGCCCCITPWDDPAVEEQIEQELESTYGGDFKNINVAQPMMAPFDASPIFPIGPTFETTFTGEGGPLAIERFSGSMNMRWPYALTRVDYHCEALRSAIEKQLHILAETNEADVVALLCKGDDLNVPTTIASLADAKPHLFSIVVDIHTAEPSDRQRAKYKELLKPLGLANPLISIKPPEKPKG